MLWRGPHGGGAASGAIGSMVASHNKGGQYLRARTTPTNPGTAFQTAVRNAITTTSNRWVETLTPEQRLGWEVYGFNTTFRNRLGDTIQLSGIAAYNRSNSSRQQAGLAIIDDAPVVFDTGDAGTQVSLTLGTNRSSGSPGTVTWAAPAPWNEAGSNNNMLLYISRPQNGSINFFKGPYRLAAVIPGDNSSNASTFAMPFATAGDGSKVFFRTTISYEDGRLSSELTDVTFPS